MGKVAKIKESKILELSPEQEFNTSSLMPQPQKLLHHLVKMWKLNINLLTRLIRTGPFLAGKHSTHPRLGKRRISRDHTTWVQVFPTNFEQKTRDMTET